MDQVDEYDQRNYWSVLRRAADPGNNVKYSLYNQKRFNGILITYIYL